MPPVFRVILNGSAQYTGSRDSGPRIVHLHGDGGGNYRSIDPLDRFVYPGGRLQYSGLPDRLQVKIRAFENIHKLVTVIVGSATLAMVGTIVAEFIAANAGIGYSIRIALYQSDLSKILVALFLIGVCTSLYLVFLEWLGSFIKKRFGSI